MRLEKQSRHIGVQDIMLVQGVDSNSTNDAGDAAGYHKSEEEPIEVTNNEHLGQLQGKFIKEVRSRSEFHWLT